MKPAQVVIFIDGREHVSLPLGIIQQQGLEALLLRIHETWDIGAEESAINSLGLCVYLFTRQPAFEIGA